MSDTLTPEYIAELMLTKHVSLLPRQIDTIIALIPESRRGTVEAAIEGNRLLSAHFNGKKLPEEVRRGRALAGPSWERFGIAVRSANWGTICGGDDHVGTREEMLAQVAEWAAEDAEREHHPAQEMAFYVAPYDELRVPPVTLAFARKIMADAMRSLPVTMIGVVTPEHVSDLNQTLALVREFEKALILFGAGTDADAAKAADVIPRVE